MVTSRSWEDPDLWRLILVPQGKDQIKYTLLMSESLCCIKAAMRLYLGMPNLFSRTKPSSSSPEENVLSITRLQYRESSCRAASRLNFPKSRTLGEEEEYAQVLLQRLKRSAASEPVRWR